MSGKRADLRWYGDKVIARMRKAGRYGINKTMGECAAVAKHSHPFQNQTGTAERSIRVSVPAQTGADGTTVGLWGSVAVGYFWFLEKGTDLMKKSYATLVPTAEKVYPRLPANIREGWARG